jgi:hypothetical protein
VHARLAAAGGMAQRFLRFRHLSRSGPTGTGRQGPAPRAVDSRLSDCRRWRTRGGSRAAPGQRRRPHRQHRRSASGAPSSLTVSAGRLAEAVAFESNLSRGFHKRPFVKRPSHRGIDLRFLNGHTSHGRFNEFLQQLFSRRTGEAGRTATGPTPSGSKGCSRLE